MVEDQSFFLIQIEKLKPYIVEFDKNGVMKAWKYSVNCVIGDHEHQTIIIITHDNCIFFVNDGIQKT